MSSKWPDAGYIAYFQAGTNTYAPVSVLRGMFYEALEQPGVVGLSVATRADCLGWDVLELLEELSRRTWLTVELGLQTVHDDTAQRINRCMSTESFYEGYAKLAGLGIDVCVHLINGLPGESLDMMVESARAVGRLCPHSVKLHLLYICEDTRIAAEYAEGMVVPMLREDYIAVVCDQLEVLPPETVISRLTGDAPREKLLAPEWSAKKFTVINDIDKELIRRGSWQGKNIIHNLKE
jgi:radical SAM protein (TIGR01212 family)